MKKNKKVISLLLTVVLSAAICLTGCGKAEVENTTDNKVDNNVETTEDEVVVKKDGKITIFQSKTEIMDDLKALAKAYTEESGVEVEVWETSGDSYYSDLKMNISTDAGPTIFSLQPGAESIEMADYLEDLGDLSFINKIGKGMPNEVDGKIVGIPYTVEGFGLVHNASLVSADEIKTADSLVAYLESNKDSGVNALGLSQEDYFLIAHILNAPFAVQENPEEYLQKVLSGDVRMIDSKAFVEFGDIMAGIRANCTNPVDITYDNNCGDFATSKTAMIHQGNWCYSMFADYDVAFDMSIAAVPVADNTKISVSVPTAWYINIDASDNEKGLAKEFIEWLYTSETGTDYLMNKFGFISVVDGMTSEKLDPISQAVSEAVIAGETIPWVMNNWPAGIVTTDLSPIAQQFFTTNMTATDFINQLNDAFVAAAK